MTQGMLAEGDALLAPFDGERRADTRRIPDPDEALVTAAQEDPAQFLALYDRYFPRIHGYVRLRIRDRSTCEDVTSLIFTTALAKIGSFRSGAFGGWLFRIAQHAVYDHYRKGREQPLVEEALVLLPDGGLGPEGEALAGERAAQLRALVGTLRPEQQHLLALRYGAGLSHVEIGRVVGKSSAAVRVTLHRTLAELRRRYPHDE